MSVEELTQFDLQWICRKCGYADNLDNYYLSRSVLCENCGTWHEWVDVIELEKLDALYPLRMQYEEREEKGE